MTTKEAKPALAQITTLNNFCRDAMHIADCLMRTQGINTLSPAGQAAVREKAETFAYFVPDTSIYFCNNGVRSFWNIDYHETTLNKGGEADADPKQTVRVLTVTLGTEY